MYDHLKGFKISLKQTFQLKVVISLLKCSVDTLKERMSSVGIQMNNVEDLVEEKIIKQKIKAHEPK